MGYSSAEPHRRTISLGGSLLSYHLRRVRLPDSSPNLPTFTHYVTDVQNEAQHGRDDENPGGDEIGGLSGDVDARQFVEEEARVGGIGGIAELLSDLPVPVGAEAVAPRIVEPPGDQQPRRRGQHRRQQVPAPRPPPDPADAVEQHPGGVKDQKEDVEEREHGGFIPCSWARWMFRAEHSVWVAFVSFHARTHPRPDVRTTKSTKRTPFAGHDSNYQTNTLRRSS